MPYPQLESFTLDVTDIEENDLLGVSKNLKQFFVEGYNPILEKIEKIYIKAAQLQAQMDRLQYDPRFGHGNSGMEGKYKELREAYKLEVTDVMQGEIKNEIARFLDNIGERELLAQTAGADVQIGDSNSDMAKHLAFVLQAIKSDKDVIQIMNGYPTDSGKMRAGLADRIMDQYLVTDFNRMKIKVVDQKGKVIIKDLNKDILRSLGAQNKEVTRNNILAELKQRLNLSDEQLKFIVSRYNQRDIQSAAGAFLAPDATLQGAGKNIFRVNASLEDGKFKINGLKSIEYKFAATEPAEGKVHIDNFGNKTIDFDPNKTVPVFNLSYKIDVSNLTANDPESSENFIALPTSKPKSAILTFEAKSPKAIFSMPYHLMYKVIDSKEVETAPRNRTRTSSMEEISDSMKDAIGTISRGLRSMSFATAVDNTQQTNAAEDTRVSPISFFKQKAGEAVRALRGASVSGIENISPQNPSGSNNSVSPDLKAPAVKPNSSGKTHGL